MNRTSAFGQLPPVWRTAALGTTLAHLVLSAVALVFDGTVRNVIAGVFVAALAAGSLLFIVAFVIAAGRSRDEQVTMIGVYFLANHSIEPAGRRLLRLCLLGQSVIGVVAASLAPFTAMAFSTLVPMLGLGVMAYVGARFGWFPAHGDEQDEQEADEAAEPDTSGPA